jgi:threonine dehydrogenase-like Zn-dependent dehydrogenase
VRRVSVPGDPVAVVGAGSSPLVPALWADGYDRLTAVDLAPEALARLAGSLPSGHGVQLVATDVRSFVPAEPVAVWHDRAVFHFLAETADHVAYVDRAMHGVRHGGHVVLATFALDGPESCSGLPVTRYDAATLAGRFARGFVLVDSAHSTHITPWGSEQRFVHVLLQRVDAS